MADLNVIKSCFEYEDDSYPECLLVSEPAEDLYDSDYSQEPPLKLRRGCREKDRNCRKSNRIDFPGSALNKTNDGSDIKAEQSYFYTGVHYRKMDKEILLEDKSLDECLEYLFKFSSSRFFDEQRCTWNGEKLADIKECDLTIPGFKWLTENDNIDWKTASQEKRSELEQFYEQSRNKRTFSMKPEEPAINVAEKTKAMYDELCSKLTLTSMEERSFRHNTMLSCMESIAVLISLQQYIHSGMCNQSFDLCVPHDLVTDDSPLIPEGREVVINNSPDGVFTFPYSPPDGQANVNLWLIPVQLYGPSSEKEVAQERVSPTADYPQFGSSPNVKPQGTCPQNLVCSSPPFVQRKDQMVRFPTRTPLPVASKVSPRDSLPPKTSLNSLLNPEYVQDARKYIAESLPFPCRRSRCVDKMAGEHVQQLLAVASQITANQQSFFENDTLEILGLFVVNEYVYFSRLDIQKKMNYFFSSAFKVPPLPQSQSRIKGTIKVFRELDSPSVSYSNFRLDLTITKHRLALMIFIRRYTHAFANVKI